MMQKFRMNIRKLSQGEEEELLERVDMLVKVGKQIEATSPSVDINNRPDYLDEKRFDIAQKVINKYYTSLAMSSSVGLMMLLQLEEILIPLLKTGKSRTVPDLYDRYSATANYIKKCYETRFYDPTSEGWKYISMVRVMHQRVYKLMNDHVDDRQANDDSKCVWVNQYDMALTQFAFIGLFILRPDKCAAPYVTEQELANIAYYWRLLSYYFCIEDRFNLFTYHDDVAKQVRYLELIFDLYRQQLDNPRNPVGVGMAEGIMLAFEDLSSEASFNIVEHHWNEFVSLSGRPQLPPYNGIAELWKLTRFKAVLKLTASSDTARSAINQAYKKKLEKFLKNGDKVKKKLTKKYPNLIYESNSDSETAKRVHV